MRCDTGPVVGAMTHARILDSEHESRPTELCSSVLDADEGPSEGSEIIIQTLGSSSVLNLSLARRFATAEKESSSLFLSQFEAPLDGGFTARLPWIHLHHVRGVIHR